MSKTVNANREYLEDLVKLFLREQMGVSEPFEGPAAAAGLHGKKDVVPDLSELSGDIFEVLKGYLSNTYSNFIIWSAHNNQDWRAALANWEGSSEDPHTQAVFNFFRLFNQSCAETGGSISGGSLSSGELGAGTAKGEHRALLRTQDPDYYCMHSEAAGAIEEMIGGQKGRDKFWSRLRKAEQEVKEGKTDAIQKLYERQYTKFGLLAANFRGRGKTYFSISHDKKEENYATISNRKNAIKLGKEFGLSENEMESFFSKLKEIYVNKRKRDYNETPISPGNIKRSVLSNLPFLSLDIEDELVKRVVKSWVGPPREGSKDAYRQAWVDTIMGKNFKDATNEAEISLPNEEKRAAAHRYAARTVGGVLTAAPGDAAAKKFLGTFPHQEDEDLDMLPARGVNSGSGIIKEILDIMYPTGGKYYKIGEKSTLEVKREVYDKIIDLATEVHVQGWNNTSEKQKNQIRKIPKPRLIGGRWKHRADTVSGAWERAKALAKNILLSALDENKENIFKILLEAEMDMNHDGYGSVRRKFYDSLINLDRIVPDFQGGQIQVTAGSPKSNLVGNIAKAFKASGQYENIKNGGKIIGLEEAKWCPLDCFPLLIDGVYENYCIANNLDLGKSITKFLSTDSFDLLHQTQPNILRDAAKDHADLGTEEFLRKYYKEPFKRRLKADDRLFHKWMTFTYMSTFDPRNRKGQEFWEQMSAKALAWKRSAKNFMVTDLAVGFVLSVLLDESTLIINGIVAPGLAAALAATSAGAPPVGLVILIVTAIWAVFVLFDPFGWFTKRKDMEKAITSISDSIRNLADIYEWGEMKAIEVGEKSSVSMAKASAAMGNIDTETPTAIPGIGGGLHKEQIEPDENEDLQDPENPESGYIEAMALREKNELAKKEINKINQTVRKIVVDLDKITKEAAQRMMHFTNYSVEEVIKIQEGTDKLVNAVSNMTKSADFWAKEKDLSRETIITKQELLSMHKQLSGLANGIVQITAERDAKGDYADSIIWENVLLEQKPKPQPKKEKFKCPDEKPVQYNPSGGGAPICVKSEEEARKLAMSDWGQSMVDCSKLTDAAERKKCEDNKKIIQTSISGKSMSGTADSQAQMNLPQVAPIPTDEDDPDQGPEEKALKALKEKMQLTVLNNIIGFHKFDRADFTAGPKNIKSQARNISIAKNLLSLSSDLDSIRSKITNSLLKADPEKGVSKFTKTHGRTAAGIRNRKKPDEIKAEREHIEKMRSLYRQVVVDHLGNRLGEKNLDRAKKKSKQQDPDETLKTFLKARRIWYQGEVSRKWLLSAMDFVGCPEEPEPCLLPLQFVADLGQEDKEGNLTKSNDAAKKLLKYRRESEEFFANLKNSYSLLNDTDFAREHGSQSEEFYSKSGLVSGQRNEVVFQGTGVWAAEYLDPDRDKKEYRGGLDNFYFYRHGAGQNPLGQIQNSIISGEVPDEIETIYKDLVNMNRPSLKKEQKKFEAAIYSADDFGSNPIKAVITYSQSEAFSEANKMVRELQKIDHDKYKKSGDDSIGGPVKDGPAAGASDVVLNLAKNKHNVIILDSHLKFIESLASLLNTILKVDKLVSEGKEGNGMASLGTKVRGTYRDLDDDPVDTTVDADQVTKMDFAGVEITEPAEAEVRDFEKDKKQVMRIFAIKHACLEQLCFVDNIIHEKNVEMYDFIKYFWNKDIEFREEEVTP